MNDTILGATIGVIGTILGAILGWILNGIGKGGKLFITDLIWKDKFTQNKNGFTNISNTKDECDSYQFFLEFNVYNSNSNIKIMKNIKIEFYKDKQRMFLCTPKDEATRKFNSHISTMDDFKLLNIYPKTVLNCKLFYSLWREDIWEVNNIYLSYQNEKEKYEKIRIKSCDYLNYFSNSNDAMK
jgi:hypothetical protein